MYLFSSLSLLLLIIQREEKERNQGTERKHPTKSQANDALIGDEEQNGKQKRTKERNREWGPNPATMDYSAASYDAQGS